MNAAVLQETPAVDHATYQLIEIRYIREHAGNPRKRFDQAKQDEMTDSIKRHGVMQPILVRPAPDDLSGRRFQLIAGARRLRGATAAGLFKIPAMVRAMSDAEVLELQLVENVQREGLHELEEAEGYERLMKEFNYSIDDLVAKANKSKSHIYGRLKLCALNEECRKAFYGGSFTASVALLLARIPDSAMQSKALADVIENDQWDGPMSFRQASDHIQRFYMLRLDRAPFPTDDADLVATAGSCTACPKRTGNQPELFGDVQNGDTCTDTACHEQKRVAFVERRRLEAEAKGQRIIVGAEAKKIMPNQYSELRGGFVKVDESAYKLVEGKNGNKTIRKLLGKDAPAPVLLEDPHGGGLVEVMRKEDVIAAFEQRGLKVQRPDCEQPAIAREKENRKLETAFRERLFAVLRETLPQKQHYDLKPIALAMYGRLFGDTQKRLDKVLALGNAGFGQHVESLDMEQVYYLLWDMVLASEVHNPVFADAKPEAMLALATRLEVDTAALRRQLKDELRKKPAAAKTEKPKKAKRPGGNRRKPGEVAAQRKDVA